MTADPRKFAVERGDYLRFRSVLRDRVTGLPTLAGLVDRIRRATEVRGTLGVIHVQAVDLELVESLYGWQVFDGILARMAAELRGAIGDVFERDSWLALDRVAGDRFLVFVTGLSGAGPLDATRLSSAARTLCQRLQRAFADDEFAGVNPAIVFRAGQALLTADPFFRFERRVYGAIAEAAGRSQQRQRQRELSWGEELRSILRAGQLECVLQPVIDLREQDAIGFEALVRGPRGGLFETPGVLFEMAERLGHERELDRLCLAEILDTVERAAVPGQIFVNVLPATLERDGEGLLALLRGWGGDPQRLVVELGERGLLPGTGGAVARLRDDGFRIAVDQVGTGTRTAESIARLRPDFVKLDRALIRGVAGHLIRQGMVEQLTALARDVGATIVATGIETEADAAAVARAGVGLGQGFHFAAPGPPSAGWFRRVRGKPSGNPEHGP